MEKPRRMIIAAIPTKYKNHIFRSRLEAKWAAYFDLIGLKWDYESEGFKLPNGKWYLPDFYIPEIGYIEIKPHECASREAKEKCRLLSKLLSCNVMLFEGSPDLKAYLCWVDGHGICDVLFTYYSVKKWQQTPEFVGTSVREELVSKYEGLPEVMECIVKANKI